MKYKNKKLFASILLAAGNSQRLGLNIAKQFCLLKDNLSVLEISLKNISPFAENIIITLPVSEIQNLELQNKLKVIAQNFKTNLFFISGGQNRFESVLKAFEIIKDKNPYLFIHDSARALTSAFDLENLLDLTIEYKAAILAQPVSDTIKLSSNSEPENTKKHIQKTISRNNLWAAQTPQAFETELYKKALNNAKNYNCEFTDDASLIELLGEKVYLVEAKHLNFKITNLADLNLARKII